MKYKATRAGQASRDPAQLRLDSERGASQLVNKDATFFLAALKSSIFLLDPKRCPKKGYSFKRW